VVGSSGGHGGATCRRWSVAGVDDEEAGEALTA
jgi:hypothetical protein